MSPHPNSLREQPWVIATRRYTTAVVSTAIVIWIRLMLHPWLNEECPFSLFYLSVLLTAWIAGTGPAVFALGLGTVAAAHFFIPPSSSLWIDSLPDLVQLAIYVFVNCVAIFLFDRAERQRTLAENRSAENERLSSSLRLADIRKDEFLALLAHELRNPLAPIRSSVALLERRGECPDVVQRTREIIQRQVKYLVRITDDLLDVSRFRQGKVDLKISPMDLRAAIQDAIELVEAVFQQKSQRFLSLIPSEPIWVDGDHVRLAQLTANLLENSAKYTPESGRITLSVEAFDDSAVINVSDNGIGFTEDQAARILEPFVQIDASRTRDYGGLGVGLTIVNRLVALHGGKLRANSRGPGMGSCFTVELPRSTDHHNDQEQSRPAPPVALTAANRSVPTSTIRSDWLECEDATVAAARVVLLVEDNIDASTVLSELLQSEGYKMHVAGDGIEALQKASTHAPDLIVMDIGLPGMDGYEIAQRLRRSPATANIKLIALTGWGGPADRELAKNAGFDLHLTKPIAFRELLNQIESLIGQPPLSPAQRSVTHA